MKMRRKPNMNQNYTRTELLESQIKVSDLPPGAKRRFELVFTAEMLDAAKQTLGLLDLGKVRITGEIKPEGRKNWILQADVGATVTQACVVTLDPMKIRVDAPVRRKYLVDWQEPVGDTVVEMDTDDESEPLGDVIDLEQIALEVVALGMPDYPRSDNATLVKTDFAAPGIIPMTDEDAKPFASLAALKEKLDP